MHTAFTTLPVVDVAGLNSHDPASRQTVAQQLGQAAREIGFLYITGHGLDPELFIRLRQRAKEYFAQPINIKMQNYIGKSTNHSGYVPEGEEQFAGGSIDHKEAYDIGFEFSRTPSKWPLLGPNQWPDLPRFREDISAYYAAVFALSQQLFRGFALALGLPEETFSSLANTPPSQLRLVHYPYHADAPVDRPGIGAHTDYECFTILLPTAPGLEVLNGAGEWIDIPLIDNAFVINIGDMLEVLSNGQFVATGHRVRKVMEERYSFPLFCACDYDTVIAPIPELAHYGNKTYTPLRCGDHIFAQTAQTFTYMKQRIAAGKAVLPEGSRHLGSYGYMQEAGA